MCNSRTMSYELGAAREKVLAAAHRVMGGRIDDLPPGPHDDAEAEYAEDGLIAAAQELARAKLADRLKRLAGGDAESDLEKRILRDAAAGDEPVPHGLRQAAAEVAVMELALLEIAKGSVSLNEIREIASDALPERAGKSGN